MYFFQIIWQLPGILGKLYVAPLHPYTPPPTKKPKLMSRNIIILECFIMFNLKKETKKEGMFFPLCVRYLVFVSEIQFLLLAEARLS